jgi:hypothetical protein
MSFKKEIKKAITNNTKFRAIKVWKVQVLDYTDDQKTMWIEVSVKKKPVKKYRQLSIHL